MYEGEFFDGKFHGKGKHKRVNDNSYEGDFIANKAHGRGKLTFKSGSTIEGYFIGHSPHGYCKKKVVTGDTYEGGYIGGLEHGKGNQRSVQSGFVEGDFVGGQVHGKAKSKTPGGETYEGDFYKGRFHGEGRYVHADGSVDEGVFVYGRYEGPSSTGTYSGGSGYTDKRGVFLSLIFGLVGGIGSAFTISWIAKLIAGFQPISGMVFLAILAAGFVVTFIAWRNRKTVLFLAMLALSVIAALVVFGVIPENFRKTQVEQAVAAAVSATVTSNVNFRAGPSTDNEIIRQLAQGTTVTLTGETSGGWTQVSHNGDTGWVSSEFLKE
jgi:hypothetical protein